LTLNRILTEDQAELLAEERRLLTEVSSVLSGCGAAADDLATLEGSVRQLDELFLLVVVGEFNSGKSAFINALLGSRILQEGVTPTTSKIHLLRYSAAPDRDVDGDIQEVVTAPVELLRDVMLVDTPGTNALDRRHEAITSDFVPRSDLVIFVTSADRPFSESEREFLQRIREWGKKIVVIVNKTDILRSNEEIAQIVSYIDEHSRRLLDMSPEIFPVSSLTAIDARSTGDDGALSRSGIPVFENHLRATLDERGRVRLKLANPLGVATSILNTYRLSAEAMLEALRSDLQILEDIEGQLAVYSTDVEREFELRLADMDNLLHRMERRGIDFFDERLRLRRVPELLRSRELQRDFELQVVADTPGTIERKVEDLIDWLVESDLRQWQAIVQHVNRRRAQHTDRIVGEIGAGFESSRSQLLDRVGGAAREGLARYDRVSEARRMTDQVQRAVANTALVEVGAVGLGATISLVISGSAADVSGLVAAGAVAALGLFILPNRRRRAKRELRDKISTMRNELMTALRTEFSAEAERSRAKIRDTIAPYDRFVRAERERFERQRHELTRVNERVLELRARVDTITEPDTP